MQQCPNRVAYLKDTVDQGRFSFVTDPRWTTFEGATSWLASSMSMNSLFEAESEVCVPFTVPLDEIERTAVVGGLISEYQGEAV